MKRNFVPLPLLLLCLQVQAAPRGVSPYLPVNLSPEMERQIEQVLILADQPVLARPIAASRVHDALPAACERDEALCASVRRYLNSFMHDRGITDASIEAGSSREQSVAVANRHGMNSDSAWQASARLYWQPNDYALLALGGVAHDGDATPTGSLLSLGNEYAQLDIGWRDYWLSPLMDSSMTLSTEAATMPSIGLSNYTPITRLGLRYQVFVAEMDRSSNIRLDDGTTTTTGKPKLVGVDLSMEPVSGWAFGLNRLLQYGGGARGGASFSDVFNAFFDPTRYDNVASTQQQQFGNQVASITSSFIYPGATPFVVNLEYAGEDTVRNRNHLLGNAALSVGIRWPVLFERFDLAIEASEWQNAWYVHPLYGDGLANDGHVIGHWAVDQRQLNDDVGGQSATVRLGWRPQFGGLAQLRYRSWRFEEYAQLDYVQGHELTLGYDRQFGEFTAGAELVAGRDSLGDEYTLVRGHVRYAELAAGLGRAAGHAALSRSSELFVDAGAAFTQVRIDENSELPVEETSFRAVPHVGVGARRLGKHGNDVGVRLEIDDVEGHLFTAVRAIDYRHRFDNSLALGFFLGAARYDRATAAYGLYYGAGAQWRDVIEGWDLGLDARYAEKVGRDHVLPEDQFGERPVSYYDIYGVNLYVTRRF